MARAERLLKLERLIRGGAASRRRLLDELEVSPATFKRDLEYLRSRLGSPIEYDAQSNRYYLAESGRGARHELPGLWFDEPELYALLAVHQLISELDTAGTLARHLQPLLERIHHLLGGAGASQALTQRIRIISAARRPVPGRHFERAVQSLLQRRRLHLRYLTRGRGQTSERDVSPQRLVHYRNTWYLDAWCHRAHGLRRFALDAIEAAEVLQAPAQEMPLERVQQAMDAGYGIYAGGTQRWATLVFAAQAAQWISHEQWHPEQRGRWLDDGRYELQVPYVDDTELVMDVLRQGDEVQVQAPAELREKVHQRLRAAAAAYD